MKCQDGFGAKKEERFHSFIIEQFRIVSNKEEMISLEIDVIFRANFLDSHRSYE